MFSLCFITLCDRLNVSQGSRTLISDYGLTVLLAEIIIVPAFFVVDGVADLHHIASMCKETPCHLRRNDVTCTIELIIQSSGAKEGDTLSSEMRLDSGKSLFNRIIIG